MYPRPLRRLASASFPLALGLVLGPLSLPAPAGGSTPLDTTADWVSYPGGVTTGGAFVDIDRDGDLDLVVANGNDILRQRVEVYHNDGLGGFTTTPQWSSGDLDYHGHLAVGDVDQDGWPDVAVSVFLGPGGFGDPGHVKLYRNLSGALEALPSWRSNDSFYTFSCDLGDADGDGDLDLAVATGEPYFDPPDRNRIYYNAGGALSANPGWQSNTVDHTLDVAFGDADGDGDLDLAFATALGPGRVFFQGPLGMSTAPGWVATDNASQNGNTVAWRDVDGDGHLELAVSDNDQLSGGSGDFKLYDNVSGALQTVPQWSDHGGYVSAVAFADLDGNGLPELAGGRWFGGTWIYGAPYPATPEWVSSEQGTVEALFFGDVDGDGLRPARVELFPPNGGRTYYVEHAPVHELLHVAVDGVPLGPASFAVDLEDGWIALDRTPVFQVVVVYRYSDSLDLGVTNWDQSVGNLIYSHDALAPRPPGRRARRVAQAP